MAPLPLARRLIDVATWLGGPPNAALQLALSKFLSEGHYLRHLPLQPMTRLSPWCCPVGCAMSASAAR